MRGLVHLVAIQEDIDLALGLDRHDVGIVAYLANGVYFKCSALGSVGQNVAVTVTKNKVADSAGAARSVVGLAHGGGREDASQGVPTAQSFAFYNESVRKTAA